MSQPNNTSQPKTNYVLTIAITIIGVLAFQSFITPIWSTPDRNFGNKIGLIYGEERQVIADFPAGHGVQGLVIEDEGVAEGFSVAYAFGDNIIVAKEGIVDGQSVRHRINHFRKTFDDAELAAADIATRPVAGRPPLARPAPPVAAATAPTTEQSVAELQARLRDSRSEVGTYDLQQREYDAVMRAAAVESGSGDFVTAVFYDPLCSYCQRQHALIDQAAKESDFRVRWIPVSVIGGAPSAALGAGLLATGSKSDLDLIAKNDVEAAGRLTEAAGESQLEYIELNNQLFTALIAPARTPTSVYLENGQPKITIGMLEDYDGLVQR